MSFKQFKLDVASFQTRGIFNTYVYQADDDTVADVLSPGYFKQSRFDLVDGDGCSSLIRCCCVDGFVEGFALEDGTILPIEAADRVENVVQIDSDYTINGTEDIILCTGALTITLIPVAQTGKSVTIQAEGGTVTFSSVDPIQGGTSNIVDGNSIKLVGKKSTNEWRIL
ncbi:MAG: hypothetical protein GY727_01780 [Gammaproteobacteria bacterium]|nr:hypothetical protein [Gammaproteobacteria bacterium]MCP4076081.1 hypothetical protein [Gammaproteobacteria bacterium]